LLQAAQSIMTKLDTNSLFQKLWVFEITLASKYKITARYKVVMLCSLIDASIFPLFFTSRHWPF
jgi:hypothetical protein